MRVNQRSFTREKGKAPRGVLGGVSRVPFRLDGDGRLAALDCDAFEVCGDACVRSELRDGRNVLLDLGPEVASILVDWCC